MSVLIAFGIAFGLSFLFMLPPGMLNMTVINLNLKKGFFASMIFAVTVAFIEFWQSLLVIKFSDTVSGYLEGNVYIKYLAIVIFVALGLSFLFAKPNKDNPKIKDNLKDSNSAIILKGISLAFANVLVYPFWLTQGIIFTHKGVLDGTWTMSIIFSIGIFLGSVGAYALYSLLAEKIIKKFDKIANNINKILSVIFFVLALIQLAQIFL